ncbi:MAG TPA: Rid family detoxifying hydrolase [Candidatus Saccharimonadales bacterium]|nr:Rid family detoxifying hydrolase [Candidatus Saccharimonadales bacterium]
MENNQKPTFGPYSPVRQAGDFIFVSGQVGIDPITKTASADTAKQVEQALVNLKNVLVSVGSSLNDIVKTTVFITDGDDFDTVNQVYVGFFGDPKPARSTVCVKELPRVAGNTPVKVEIEAIALAART